MVAFLWIFLPVFIAAGSALLSFYIMQARMEVALARERESTAEVRAAHELARRTYGAEGQSSRRGRQAHSVDSFLADFRVEERHYMRESKSLFMNKKSMVLQERLYFRTIPLSNWVEHELVVEEGGDLLKLAKACSVFSPKTLAESAVDTTKLLRSA